MCAPKAPAPPDYAGAAQQQGQANLEAARLQTHLNRPDQVTPWGTQTWSQDPNNPDSWTSTIQLDPAQQQLLDSSNRISQNLANVSESGLNRVGDAMATPFSTEGLPALSGAPDAGRIQSNIPTQELQTGIRNRIGSQGVVPRQQMRTDLGTVDLQGSIQTPDFQRNLDANGLTMIPGANDFSADRQRVEDALMARQEVDFGRQEESMRQQLANQGIAPGSEAWAREFDSLNRARVDARNQAILAGGQEQSRLFGMGSSARAQQFGERQAQGAFTNDAASRQLGAALSAGQFANDAATQRFGQNLTSAQFGNDARGQQFGQDVTAANLWNTAAGQDFSQDLQAGQFGNDARAQMFAQLLAAGQFGNAAQQQAYTQGMSSAQMNNTARQQGIQEQAYLRQLPLNELNALRTGTQVQAPTFNNTPTAGTVAPAPVFGAAQAQGQWDQNAYAQQMGGFNNMMGGLFSLGSAGILASDRRLKTGVIRIGTTAGGLPLYQYRYLNGEPGIGVMADEAELIQPAAVVEGPAGYRLVNYRKVV